MSLFSAISNPIIPQPVPQPDQSTGTSDPTDPTQAEDTQSSERTTETNPETGSGQSNAGSGSSSEGQTVENGSGAVVLVSAQSVVRARVQADNDLTGIGEVRARQIAEATRQKLLMEQLIKSIALVETELGVTSSANGTTAEAEESATQDRLAQRV